MLCVEQLKRQFKIKKVQFISGKGRFFFLHGPVFAGPGRLLSVSVLFLGIICVTTTVFNWVRVFVFVFF